MAIEGRQIWRIQADGAKFGELADINNSNGKPTVYRGNDLAIEVSVFYNDSLCEDLSDIQKLVLKIKALGTDGAPPLATASDILSQEIINADLNDAVTMQTWKDGSAEHARFLFTGTETNVAELERGDKWLAIYLETTHTTGRNLTLIAGPCEWLEDGV